MSRLCEVCGRAEEEAAKEQEADTRAAQQMTILHVCESCIADRQTSRDDRMLLRRKADGFGVAKQNFIRTYVRVSHHLCHHRSGNAVVAVAG